MDIHVGRYSPKERESHGYTGWIEDDARTWIMFIENDGSPTVYLHRDSDGGVVE